MRVQVVERVTARELKGAIREHVNRASTIMTDQWPSYRGIGKEYDGGHNVRRAALGKAVDKYSVVYFLYGKAGTFVVVAGTRGLVLAVSRVAYFLEPWQ